MTKHPPFIAADNLGVVCDCVECRDAKVDMERMRKVPGTAGKARWLHGWELRRWLDARDKVRKQFGHLVRLKDLT